MEPKFALAGSQRQQICTENCLTCHMRLKFGNYPEDKKELDRRWSFLNTATLWDGNIFPETSIPALGTNHPPIKRVPWFIPGGKSTGEWKWPLISIRLQGMGKNVFTLTYTWLKWLWIVCKVLKRGNGESAVSIPHDPPTLNSKLLVSTVPTIRRLFSVTSLIRLLLTLEFAVYFRYGGTRMSEVKLSAEHRSFYRRWQKTDFRSRWNYVC